MLLFGRRDSPSMDQIPFSRSIRPRENEGNQLTSYHIAQLYSGDGFACLDNYTGEIPAIDPRKRVKPKIIVALAMVSRVL